MVNHPNRRRKVQAAVAVAPPRITLSDTRASHDADWSAFIESTRKAFDAATGPLFTTNAGGLYDTYLSHLPGERQVHTCSHCRQFIDRFGGLVTIGENGHIQPAMWANPLTIPAFYRPSNMAVQRLIGAARVTGPFLSAETMWGTPLTDHGKWSHLAVQPPPALIYRNKLLTAGQAMAAKREDFRTVAASLADFTPDMLREAMRLLEADKLARSERFIGPIQWLQKLHEDRAAVRGPIRDNILWRAIVTAPDGFCHPRASVIGSLLEDIAAGLPFDDVKSRFNAKMHPLMYQRPQAAPAWQAIAQAEKMVEQLGIARSLERRFARLEEIEAIWRPTPSDDVPSGGVFGHLKPKRSVTVEPLDIPPQTMTWEKFARTVLPEAEAISLYIGQGRHNFITYTSAVHADAPPILKWDRDERRCPIAWYVWHGGSPPEQYGLRGGSWCDVAAICTLPTTWGDKPQPWLSDGVTLMLKGAIDTRTGGGNALFPECLRPELHGVRSVVEAYSRRAEFQERENGSACGMDLRKAGGWPGYVLRVTSRGQTNAYRLDRWD